MDIAEVTGGRLRGWEDFSESRLVDKRGLHKSQGIS